MGSRQELAETRAELQDRYLEIIAEGKTSAYACRALGIGWRTPTAWAARDGTFAERREAARAAGADLLSNELLTVPREFEPGRARVITENIRWLLSKWQPATYGDKLDLNVNQTVDIGPALAAGRARVSRLVRDHESIEDAQVIERTHGSGDRHTDSQSDPTLDPAFLALLE